MKTNTLVGILLCFLMGCVNKTQKTTVADKADSATNITILDEKAYEAAVDQSAGWETLKI